MTMTMSPSFRQEEEDDETTEDFVPDVVMSAAGGSGGDGDGEIVPSAAALAANVDNSRSGVAHALAVMEQESER